jgi:hypothetical protein
MSIIQTLTEGMVNRNMQREGAALLNKWSQTGLLEGLSNDEQRSGMARLLENQARELLRESNTMAGGDVEGFAAVAFPIVRRVFAGLIANDLVSVQPMSLPSGLIFFLDFTFGTDPGAGLEDAAYTRLGNASGSSIYGQGIVGKDVIDGVDLSSAELDKQPYGFGSAYSSPTASIDGAVGAANTYSYGGTVAIDGSKTVGELVAAGDAGTIEFDADLVQEHSASYVLQTNLLFADLTANVTAGGQINRDRFSQIVVNEISGAAGLIDVTDADHAQVRRLARLNDAKTGVVLTFLKTDGSAFADTAYTVTTGSFPITDNLENVGNDSLGAIRGTALWGLEGSDKIPEIDIKVDSIAITTQTKKLKAKWTPELGQDLNAYHNLDAEVELTSILSEQIALEIDREILEDLIRGATAGTFYWSRSPGMFVNRLTGAEIGANTAAPDFTGTVSEWYETLIETINDVSAQIHRKTLRGGANFVVLSPEVANVLEFTAGFRANVTADADKGDIGAVKVGSLNRKFDVIVDPYFPRNAILVGRKGSSFLESGYVYAPYVPLQTTPTIFGPEDFVPRKGVMTRYGKKMVRPDMYGLVIVRGLLGGDDGTGT